MEIKTDITFVFKLFKIHTARPVFFHVTNSDGGKELNAQSAHSFDTLPRSFKLLRFILYTWPIRASAESHSLCFQQTLYYRANFSLMSVS